ncbi:DUF5359 family protein [Bacillus licheniformis]|nr:DUF5359 family protein [Bacillus licheniformis]
MKQSNGYYLRYSSYRRSFNQRAASFHFSKAEPYLSKVVQYEGVNNMKSANGSRHLSRNSR